MLDELIPQIEQLRAEGGVVVLKGDGERSIERCTVVVTRKSTDDVWRKDCEDIQTALKEALSEYRAHHALH